MKSFLLCCLLCLSAGFVYGQNPDGHSASLHITPSWFFGSGTFEKNTQIPSLPYSDPFVVQDTGARNYPTSFGINLMLKIPTASYLTLSVSYSFNQYFEEDRKYEHYWYLDSKLHKISVTASIYNLFSVY